MARERFFADDFQTDALNARRRPSEIFIHDFGVDADGFKNLRAVITLNRRDAHLGHRFDNAFDGGLDKFFDGNFMVGFRQKFFAHQIGNCLEREIWIDGRAAVTNQNGEMMHFARFAGFKNQTDFRARAAANQMMMQAGNREQCGNRRQRHADATVGKNHDVGAVNNRFVSRVKNFFKRCRKTLRAVSDLE